MENLNKNSRKRISFVIPCYGSEKTVEYVLNEIAEKMKERADRYDYEVIAVNDCSPDHVMDVLRKAAFADSRIKVINLAGNVGKHGAVLAGYKYAEGQYVVSLDDDGQCPVEFLWKLIEPLENGHAMAMAEYSRKKESAVKRFGSKVNHWMAQSLLKEPSGVTFTNFIARQAFMCKAMAEYSGSFPYLEGLSLRISRDIVMVPMEERPRLEGRSNYTFKKSVALWMNGFTAFSAKPLHVGYAVGAVSLLFAVVNLFLGILGSNLFYVTACVFFCTGIVSFQLGLIGEYVGRTYITENRYPLYVVNETINL